jgi:hypothetical protein
MDIHEFIEEHQSAASKYIKRYFTPITSEQLGIDKRAGSCLYLTEVKDLVMPLVVLYSIYVMTSESVTV